MNIFIITIFQKCKLSTQASSYKKKPYSVCTLIIYLGLILFDNISLVDILMFTRIIQTIEQRKHLKRIIGYYLVYVLVNLYDERISIPIIRIYGCFIFGLSYDKIIKKTQK